MQGEWVRSLIGELRSCMPCGSGKKKNVAGLLGCVFYLDHQEGC